MENNNNMKMVSKVYYDLIKKGKKTLDDIPNKQVRQEVQYLLEFENKNG